MQRSEFKVPSCKAVFAENLPIIRDCLTQTAEAHYSAVLKELEALKIPYVECPQLVRGLDYYTHTIFEVTHSALGSQDALGGGGRYDNLVKSMGGPETGAVGFAIGEERLLLALAALSGGAEEKAKTDVFLVALDDTAISESLVLADKLRTHGLTVGLSLEKASLKSQFRRANDSGAKSVLVRGESERAKAVWNLKNMETSEQREISEAEILKEIVK